MESPAYSQAVSDRTRPADATARLGDLTRALPVDRGPGAVDATAALERAADRTRRLARVATSLAEVLVPEEAASVVVEHGLASLGADAGVVALLTPDGKELEVVAEARASHVDLPDVDPRWRRFSIEIASPLSELARTGRPVYIESVDELAIRYPETMPSAERRGAKAVLAVPVFSSGCGRGSLTLTFPRSTTFDADDRIFVETLAQQCALALVRARLFDAEQAARAAADKAKGDFLRTLSHEWRTPLVAIDGMMSLLADGLVDPVTERQRALLSRIRVASRRLADMAEEIFSFAEMEAGRETTHMEEVDVRSIARDPAVIGEPAIIAKGLRFEATSDGPELRAVTDAAKVRRILVNLLSNAGKFTDLGMVRLTAGGDDTSIVIQIKDSGLGISDNDLARIWEAFWQVEQSTTRRVDGTGLGLTVARRLAALIGAELTVMSRIGRASTFRLTVSRR